MVLLLAVPLCVCLFLFWWFGKAYIARPAYNRPVLFQGITTPYTIAFISIVGPIIIIAAAFIQTNYGWWFLTADIVAKFILAPTSIKLT